MMDDYDGYGNKNMYGNQVTCYRFTTYSAAQFLVFYF